jgi:hypothetical protein
MDIDRSKVPQIQSGDRRGADALADRCDDPIDKTEPEIPVPGAELVCPSEIAFAARIHDIPALREVSHECQLRLGSDMGCQQIVDLGKDRPGKKPVRVTLEEVAQCSVMFVICVHQSEDRPGIGDDH